MKVNKYRAWDKEEQRMWHNVQNAYDTLGHHCCEKEPCTGDSNFFSPCSFGSIVDVEEDESKDYIVMQYIGRKDDINENELYEDDLIIDGQMNVGKIFYSEKQSAYLVNWKRNDGSYETDSCIGYGMLYGNIHENPKLWKG